jgi:hypothetical protein
MATPQRRLFQERRESIPMRDRTLSPHVFITALGIVCILTTVIEWRAVSATDPPPRTIDRAYCIRCHSDAAMMRKMRLKEGGAGFLFRDKTGPWASADPAACPIAPGYQAKSAPASR